MSRQSAPPYLKRSNIHRRLAPVEPLAARVLRLRIARGYSVYELAAATDVLACTIQRLESGKPVDKRILLALATALGVPLCRLVCGDHCCVERACVPVGRGRAREILQRP
jgi:helix-turn-helix protein